MKKFVAMLLAVMMILSCAALAADTDMKQAYIDTVTKDNNGFKVENNKVGTQKTDVWLQVEASGTIDVTVPLVLVFSTNINGGSDESSDAYKITNNSTAALKVTKVEITDQNTDVTTNGQSSNMTMVETLTGTGTYDEYTLTMNVEDRYTDQQWTSALNVASNSNFTKDDLTYTKTSDTVEGKGLWRIEKAGATKEDSDETINLNESRVTFDLATSALSFVTKQAGTQNESDTNKTEQGVKLFNVVYTVKIDDSTAVGSFITGKGTDETNQSYTYTEAASGN